MQETITIPIEVSPDLVIIKSEKERYGDKMVFRRYTYIFSHEMCQVYESDENGQMKGYQEREFVACRVNNGKVQTLDRKLGWIVDLIATREYMNKSAEESILN